MMKPAMTIFAEDSGPLRRFLDVPHRGFFACGVITVLVLALWWMFALYGPGVTGYPPAMIHALLMPLGVFPLFMLGFIFTAGPKWLGVEAPRMLFPVAVSYFTGELLALAGFGMAGHWAAFGLLIMLVAWNVAAFLWFMCITRSQAKDKRHAWRLFFAMAVGSLAMLSAVAWARSGDARFWLASTQIALWAFLLPVFLTVSHRMIPYFTQAVLPQLPLWRPYGLLDVWLLACSLIAAAVVADYRPLGALAALTLAVSLAYTSWRWHLVASLSNRLLAMLHLSFAWLAPALLLQGLGALGVAVGAAPAHALALGFCVTMLVGFVTRVTLGHGGRPLVADTGYWAIYLGLHGVALLRVAVALFHFPAAYLHIASAAWVILMAAWAVRVLPIYWRPRADGKPG